MSSLPAGLHGEHLRKTFGSDATRTLAVSDVSVHIEPGQVALVMGPSGCGKSTLLALLSGLLRPDAGRVVALGQEVWGLSDLERRRFRLRSCGFIFQAFNLFPALTAREQLEMVLRWGEALPRREARRRVAETLEWLGLHGKEDMLPAELSGGEKQRVAIGRALVKNPLLCFADEPTSALDWARGEQIVQLLRQRTRQTNAIVLMVSHDSRIIKYADQVVGMEDGRLTDAPHAGGDHGTLSPGS